MTTGYRFWAALTLALPLALAFSTPARAGWTVCNRTATKVGMMIAIEPPNTPHADYEVRGPLFIEVGQCQEIISGDLDLNDVSGYSYEYWAQQLSGPQQLSALQRRTWTGGPGGISWHCIDHSGKAFDYTHQSDDGPKQPCPAGASVEAFRGIHAPDGPAGEVTANDFTLNLTEDFADPPGTYK